MNTAQDTLVVLERVAQAVDRSLLRAFPEGRALLMGIFSESLKVEFPNSPEIHAAFDTCSPGEACSDPLGKTSSAPPKDVASEPRQASYSGRLLDPLGPFEFDSCLPCFAGSAPRPAVTVKADAPARRAAPTAPVAQKASRRRKRRPTHLDRLSVLLADCF